MTRVIVIGEVPGHPELLTLRAEQELAAATEDTVVWLVPGDPFLDAADVVARLVEEGFDVEIVPGVALAMVDAAAQLRPLTTRHESPGVTIVPDPEYPDVDWPAVRATGLNVVEAQR